MLIKVDAVPEAPPDAYIFYCMTGGIYYLKNENYRAFNNMYSNAFNPTPLTMDLACAPTHSVIFDIDFTPSQDSQALVLPAQYVDQIDSVFKSVLLRHIPNFTYIIAMRDNHLGIHVHLPELEMAYDDYILLCQSLQIQLYCKCAVGEFRLDILQNAMLPGVAKPGKTPYKPWFVVYVDERHSFSFSVANIATQMDRVKKDFKRCKANDPSFFRHLVAYAPNMAAHQLKQMMMPVVVVLNPVHKLMYSTVIARQPACSSDFEDVASFQTVDSNVQYVCKGKILRFDESHILKAYMYLKHNAANIVELETNNHALKMWYRRLRRKSDSTVSHIPEPLRELHQVLRAQHTHLAENPNPLKTIMQYNKGYYFIPVFCALCQHFENDCEYLVRNLFPLLDTEFHPLLEKMAKIYPRTLTYAVSDVTANTLHFCANNLFEQPSSMRRKLEAVIVNTQRSILSVTSQDQMVDLLRSIQERHFPILVLRLRNALKKPSRYMWNFLSESWQEVTHSSEISDLMANLWMAVRQYLVNYRNSGGIGGPEESLIDKFSVGAVVSSIMSDTNMERKDIQMDTHKWFIRSKGGILDLLTGHIGGVVPEFFLSDRTLGIDFSRDVMMTCCNHSEKWEELYRHFVDPLFFYRYLKRLFLDESGCFFETLQNIVAEELPHLALEDPMVVSMLHFYTNVGKCTCFDYDILMYLLDVLSSVFIATNYERKFFVCKGLTRNGKSKLLELMGSVFGGYCRNIQSENLTPTNSVSNATPELASTLFSCRMVTSEELEGKLNENRVKQITGNSFVTFRNMYEQNSGGIPTAKLFATTNNYPECKASEAFKDRVVAIPFEATFVDGASPTTSEQVRTNTFGKDVYVVEKSHAGCFLVLYYHLKHNIRESDGLLHYRKEPDAITEFTHDYLIHADIYVQFKVHMDVQTSPGSVTTLNDLRSAVRQFLKTTRNTSFHETDLFVRFEEEFKECRRTDIQLTTFRYTSVLDAGPGMSQLGSEEDTAESEDAPRKKAKQETSMIYYDGVVIKNLRRASLEN